jgi:hypothetical protein
LHAIQENQVSVCVSDVQVQSNSPFGSWMNVYFPLKKDANLRAQYQLLNLNSLRIGRIMSIVDALASDACTNYLRDHKSAT